MHLGLRARPQEEYLALLLTAPGDVDAGVFNADASRRWHHFMTILRRRFPDADLQYWRVAELQARGHVHFHVVLRGLRYLPIEDGDRGPGLRTLAVTAGFGRWVGVKRPRDYPGGVRSLGWYFSKYLLKHYQRGAGVTKIVTMSQGWRVGWVKPEHQPGKHRWLYAGPTGAPWRLLGQEVVPGRAASVQARWEPSWWRHHWRYYRRRETRPIAMGLKPGNIRQGRPLTGAEPRRYGRWTSPAEGDH